MLNNIMANIVSCFHILVILYVILTPIVINNISILFIHILFILLLMLHWFCNTDICCLTVCEAYLRNIPTTNTFTYPFISRLYNIPQNEWNQVIWIITIIILIISLINFYKKIKKIHNFNDFKRNLSSY